MVKKKIDNRIRVMIENGVKTKHRTMFVIVGDKGRDQVKQREAKKFQQIKILTKLLRCRFFTTCSRSPR